MIVAFFIMIFVVSSITKSKDISNSDVNIEIRANVGSIITTAEQSTETFKVISTPEVTIKGLCEENYSAYLINNNVVRIENLVLYSPEQVKGRKIYTWAKEYKMPMKITNVLYLSDPDHKYIFVNSSEDNKILNIVVEFPENMSMEIINYEELKNYEDKNFNYYTFIIVNSDNINNFFPTDTKIRKKSAIVVFDFESFNFESGKVDFYNYYSLSNNWVNDGTLDYAGKAMLYGAIFSGNKDMYECNTQKLLQKSETIYRIYNYTIRKQNDSITKSVCIHTHYPNAIGIVKELMGSVKSNDFEGLYSNSLNLELINKRSRKDGCPLIY